MKLSRALAALALLAPCAALADNARFDLQGPRIDIRVTRGGVTLPIAQVPNLLPGDKLWLKADLPADQRNHLLLIVAFLRGTTNEPPDNWFTEIDTWDRKHTAEGTTVTVPPNAEQALLFVAPETGGDFKTLRSAVKGRPGLFIRADSDLNEASFEQQRIEHYLAAMKSVPRDDPKAIQDHSAKLAATLNLKPNGDCFKQPVEQQVTCLTQSSAPVLLSDGHGQSVAEALSTGPSSDFINAASYTSAAGAGVYSAYVGAVVDLVHLVSTLHTAQYQYIPGLSFPQGSTLNLKLNAPFSFINPKSVIVIGLPAIQKAQLPPLRPQHPQQVACLLQPKMPLLLQGAPLVFATSFAHDLTLHLNRADGPTDIPLVPDASEGGLITTAPDPRQPLKDQPNTPKPAAPSSPTAPSSSKAASTDLHVTGTVRGFWGFDPFEGPTLTLQQVDATHFKVTGNTQLLAGQDNHLTLDADGTACVEHISLDSATDKNMDVSFKPAAPGKDDKPANAPLDLNVSLKKVQPGGYTLAIQQFGAKEPQKVPLTAYTSDIRLEVVRLHTGDSIAELSGGGLTNVAEVTIAGQTFQPTGTPTGDVLHLTGKSAVSPADGSEAQVKLKDGRTLPVKITTEAPRPTLQLASLNAVAAKQDNALPVTLTGKDQIPLDGKLTFVVQTRNDFPHDETIEVATADGGSKTRLSLAANNLILQDPHTAIGTLDPLKAFGQSAFGKLQLRPVAADGTPGDWIPLGTLVRLPRVSAIDCTSAGPQTGSQPPAPTCTLDGNNLFLVQSFASTHDFTKPADVPSGFAQNTLPVPTPADGSTLFLKLRDDPTTVATIKLPKPLTLTAAPTANPAATSSPATPSTPTSAAPTTTPSTATGTPPAAPSTPQPNQPPRP